jgi:voltage-gated potassium channel
MQPSDKILGALIATGLSILGISTVFFHYIEQWSWIDAWFFTVTTVSTVGYGNLVPATVIGKLATTALIFFGIGIFGLTLTQIADRIVARRLANAKDKKGGPVRGRQNLK